MKDDCGRTAEKPAPHGGGPAADADDSAERDSTMEEKTYKIPNISCGHCTASIRNELTELTGVVQVDGNPAEKTVTVQWKAPATEAGILARLKEIHYPPEG